MFHTFGCKVNTYDTGLLEKRLQDQIVPHTVHVLNTCAVTAEATKEAMKLAQKLKSKNPLSTVVVTGCAAQVDTVHFEALEGVDLVVANSHKGDLQNILEGYFKGHIKQKTFKSNIFKKLDLEEEGGMEASHTRSFLKIQDGCNSFCTFCVIPFARGKSRSIPLDHLVSKIKSLTEEGVQEVVLTGVHIGDYQDNSQMGNPLGLEDLIDAILKRTSMPRIRLSSLEPVEVTSRLLDLYQNKRLCAHFHMSIQSANSQVLSGMKRKYSAAEVEVALNRIHDLLPEAFVGMDVIAGFPGESEDQHQDTLHRLRQLPWSRIHVFPYSRRPGTRAEKMEGHLDDSLIRDRARELRALSAERLFEVAQKQVGSTKFILPFKKGVPQNSSENFSSGITRDYWTVLVNETLDPNYEHMVKITGQIFENGNARLTAEAQIH